MKIFSMKFLKLIFSSFFGIHNCILVVSLKAPITTAADDIHKYFLIALQRKEDLIFHVNPLLGRGFT